MGYGKAEVLALLKQSRTVYRLIEHPAVYTSEEGRQLQLPQSELVAKNLFLRDDKKQAYYLISVRQEKRVDLKKLRQKLNSRPLTFARESELEQLLQLKKGAVTPLGVLNDVDHRVTVLLDRAFADGVIGVHPNDNTATIWLQTRELVRLLQQCGTSVDYLEFLE